MPEFYPPRSKRELVNVLHRWFPHTSKKSWQRKDIKVLYAVWYKEMKAVQELAKQVKSEPIGEPFKQMEMAF